MTTSKTADELAAEEESREDIRHFAAEIAYMETHDISEELAASLLLPFEINLPPRRRRYALDAELSETLASIADHRGVPPEALLNQWVREKIAEATADGTAK